MEAWAYVERRNGKLDHIVVGFRSKADVEDYIRSYENPDPAVKQEAKPQAEAEAELRAELNSRKRK